MTEITSTASQEKLLAVARSRHRQLRDEVIVSQIYAYRLEAEVRRVGELASDSGPDCLAADPRLHHVVQMKHGILGMQGNDRVWIVVRPCLVVGHGKLRNAVTHRFLL